MDLSKLSFIDLIALSNEINIEILTRYWWVIFPIIIILYLIGLYLHA